MTLEHINRADRGTFIALLGDIFEHSPWVAERCWNDRPFKSIEALHIAMLKAVYASAHDQRLALVRAHPELAGREASAGTLTADSTSEQGRLGFTALSRDEFERIKGTNSAYVAKFGFPCIVALRLHQHRDSVLAEMEQRLGNDADTELQKALEQIGHITRGRLDKLLEAC